MKDAIRMANVYINLPEFEAIRESYFDIDRPTLERQVARVKFDYVRHEDCYNEGDDDEDEERWAETDAETGLDNVTIKISDFFLRRILSMRYKNRYNLNEFIVKIDLFILKGPV